MTTADAQDVSVSDGNGSDSGKIWINEFEQNPSGSDSDNEWVELYNSGTSDVDVTDWVVSSSDGSNTTVVLSGTISAGGYMVVTNSGQWLDNSNEKVTLTDNAGTLIDETPVLDDSKGFFSMYTEKIFYLDIEANIADPDTEEALEELRNKADC